MREPVVFFLILVILFLYFFVIPLDIICSLLVVLLKQLNGFFPVGRPLLFLTVGIL
jgi:hypothetical protein